jgi:hypothetical protein
MIETKPALWAAAEVQKYRCKENLNEMSHHHLGKSLENGNFDFIRYKRGLRASGISSAISGL